MQNLSNTPVPQWKIKYDSKFNAQPQQNAPTSNTAPENGGPKFPWLFILLGSLMIIGLATAVNKSNQQNNDKNKPT
jgi:hypothetical protein